MERLPTPVFLPGEFHGQRSLAGCNLWVHKESDTTEQLTFSLFCLKMWFKKLKLTVLFSENFPSFRCGRNWQKSDVSGKSIPFRKLAFLKNQWKIYIIKAHPLLKFEDLTEVLKYAYYKGILWKWDWRKLFPHISSSFEGEFFFPQWKV